jgi:hypothetical protein
VAHLLAIGLHQRARCVIGLAAAPVGDACPHSVADARAQSVADARAHSVADARAHSVADACGSVEHLAASSQRFDGPGADADDHEGLVEW